MTSHHFRNLRIAAFVLACSLPGLAPAAPLAEPPRLDSRNGVLDILMVARPQRITLGGMKPEAWVYEICRRPAAHDTCPAGSGSVSPYGGVHLHLNPGDRLKVRLVNRLPSLDATGPFAPDHAKDPANAHMALLDNPTNLHTHGLIVEPRRPSPAMPSFGDTIFVLNYNHANTGTPIPAQIPGIEVRKDVVDYDIPIPNPPNSPHPSGLFWFHPHAHGLALNQVSAGLAGIITIGKPRDYLCDDGACTGFGAAPRHLVLKDMQVVRPAGAGADRVQTQEDPTFCGAPPPAPPGQNGVCPGTAPNANWFFTVNGQVFPNWTATAQRGELWRITNASGSVTYNLHLTRQADGGDMRFQVVSMDGTTVGLSPGLSADRLGSLFGGKFKPEPCGDAGRDLPFPRGTEPVCADSIRLMPSARIEIFVTWRDASGRHVDPPPGATALLRNASAPDTGGDAWPNVVLASIGFRGALFPHPGVAVKGPAGGATAAYLARPAEVMLPQQRVAVPADLATAALAGALPAGDARLAQPGAAATALRQLRPGAPGIEGLTLQPGLPCKPLPAHWRRRILFGVPVDDPNAFGLGYELVDDGNAVRERQEIAVFQHDRTTVCVPLKGGVPATETWELVNLAGEDHNFHIHQTRFQVLPDAAAAPAQPGAPGVVFQDNVPVPRAAGGSCDGTLDPATHQPPAGCTTTPVFVAINFQELGDFVYHCHILEHEDGGMMARISVRAVP